MYMSIWKLMVSKAQIARFDDYFLWIDLSFNTMSFKKWAEMKAVMRCMVLGAVKNAKMIVSEVYYYLMKMNLINKTYFFAFIWLHEFLLAVVCRCQPVQWKLWNFVSISCSHVHIGWWIFKYSYMFFDSHIILFILQAAFLAMKSTGGKLLVFQSGKLANFY